MSESRPWAASTPAHRRPASHADAATLDMAGFLAERRTAILDRAIAEVLSSSLPHYAAAGPAETAKRLAALFDAVVVAAAGHRLEPALSHADAVAAERHQSGHRLSELQRAVNALEEQLWYAILDEVPVGEQGYALGLVSTVLGAIKDRVACAYVSRAASQPTHTLRVEELFRGNAAGEF